MQFHGKWPFTRVLGMQEPASVLFSAGNFLAHYDGLHNKIRVGIPASYPLRPYYVALAYVSMAAWVFSSVFHTRDFALTEQLDYFGAGASVLYGLYYTVVRLFRLDRRTPERRALRRAWTGICAAMYLMHVAYLKLWAWGLHVQHGGERGGWRGAECAVELVQLESVQEQQGVGGLAGNGGRVGVGCDESGAAGLPAAVGGAGCA